MTSDDDVPSPRRRPKGDKRARTRARIIEVAAQLVEERGFERTTVQEVARRAGLSNGAIYGNFKNRDEIFAAIGPTYWPQVKPQFTPGSSFAEKMRAVAEATIAILPERSSRGHARLTGLAYVLTNEALRTLVQDRASAFYAGAAEWWRSLPEDEQPPMPPDILVRLLNVLTEGLTLQWLLTPELVTDEIIHAAFAALAGVRPTL
ncbi:TetR/AcrR family transcriptional regulator [Phenylobacterium sp.]|uniref:TetR/AcrR family transcriptional regulator n=1 Tax=Phenylobacterium sp. TaxID=1871053 RepID=UPI003BAB4E9C